ncbi:MAG: hypothetical protein ACP5GX_05675 [Anaerolineae bacterium]
MTKKSRSKSRLSKTQRYRPTTASPVVPKRAQSVRSGTGGGVPTEEELAQEYRYVIEDLKRIGILAFAMLVSLVVLAVIIV